MTPLETLRLYPPHDGTLWGVLESRAARDPDRPFLRFEGRSWSWGGFRARVQAAACMLAARGVGRGDRVAVMAANSDHFVVLFFALARLGAILVPVNPEFGPAEAAYVFDHAEVCGIVADVLPERTGPWLLAMADVDAAIAAAPDVPLPNAQADDVCLIMYTSGTTGFPKGVMHRQASFVMAGEGFVERMHLQPDERMLCILPLFHINALFYSLGGAVAAGAALILAKRFSASGFWRLVADSGATQVNIIAAIGNILTRRPRTEFAPGHCLRKVYGAPVSAEIARVFTEEFGVADILEGYGMTEIPGACNQPFVGERRIGSMGQPARHPDPALHFAELKVVDDDGAELPPGEVGELLVRTPIVMKGYYRDSEQTAGAFRDGWFATGDLVKQDADCWFWFVARRKDIIRRRGENVSGAELDRVLIAHPDIAEAAAVAVPSELGEDDILAAVVAKAPLSAEDVRDWCARHLAPIKLPRYVLFVDALPHTPTHRVAKFKLTQDPGLKAMAVDLESARKLKDGGANNT